MSLGIIANTKKSVLKLVDKLSPNGKVLGLCYEAGPCGYELYCWVKQTGHDCEVVTPSKIPKKAGERVKTDRRDAVKLASLFRSGELTPVWVVPSINSIRDPRSEFTSAECSGRRHGNHGIGAIA